MDSRSSFNSNSKEEIKFYIVDRVDKLKKEEIQSKKKMLSNA